VEVTPGDGHVVFVQRDYQDDAYIEDAYRCTVTTNTDNTFGWGWELKPRPIPPVE
jgi:hypothetical protein